MTTDASKTVRRYLEASRDTLAATMADGTVTTAIVAIAQAMETSLRAGGKILLAGNGGSAADAQHIAGELLSRLNFDRAPLAAVALTTDSAVLTAIGNDYGYEDLFSRQVRGLGRKGDVLIAISTSGSSPNILKAVAAAKEIGVQTVAFTGNRNTPLAGLCDLALRVPTPATPQIQQIYMMAAHAMCELVENALFGAERRA